MMVNDGSFLANPMDIQIYNGDMVDKNLLMLANAC